MDILSELYLTHHKLVKNLCHKHTGLRDVDDLTQDIWIKILLNIHKCKHTLVEGWIYMVTYNYIIDDYRKRSKCKISYEYDLNELQQIADTQLEQTSLSHTEINELVGQLSPKYRTVFELYHFQNYHHDEIAAELNIHPVTSRTNLHRAKKQLKTLFYERTTPNRRTLARS